MKHCFPAATVLLLMLTGCFSSQYRDTAYFDLTPSRTAVSRTVSVAELRNLSGAGSRFQYREPTGRILADPDNKWVLPPGALVARALRSSLTPPKNAVAEAETQIHGELLFFESVRATRKFHLQAHFRIVRSDGKPRTLNADIEVPLSGDGPEDVVRAANQAVGKLAVQLAKAL